MAMADDRDANEDGTYDSYAMDLQNSQYIKEEIVAERRICYYSSFDLNINDWF